MTLDVFSDAYLSWLITLHLGEWVFMWWCVETHFDWRHWYIKKKPKQIDQYFTMLIVQVAENTNANIASAILGALSQPVKMLQRAREWQCIPFIISRQDYRDEGLKYLSTRFDIMLCLTLQKKKGIRKRISSTAKLTGVFLMSTHHNAYFKSTSNLSIGYVFCYEAVNISSKCVNMQLPAHHI